MERRLSGAMEDADKFVAEYRALQQDISVNYGAVARAACHV